MISGNVSQNFSSSRPALVIFIFGSKIEITQDCLFVGSGPFLGKFLGLRRNGRALFEVEWSARHPRTLFNFRFLSSEPLWPHIVRSSHIIAHKSYTAGMDRKHCLKLVVRLVVQEVSGINDEVVERQRKEENLPKVRRQNINHCCTFP